jgi:hypothetical protein
MALSLVAILLSGCASIATNVALVNIMAAERSLEPAKPKRVNGQRGTALDQPLIRATSNGRGDSRERPAHFASRFGQWKKTKLDLWGPA